jgi:DNA-directed RNA polymerase subunit L
MLEENIQLKIQKYDIKISEVENHASNGLDASWLVLNMSGNDFNIKLANSLRRASSNNVPTYAIPQELITIDTNTTVAFNNDYMRLRLSQLPVYGVDSELYFLAEKYWSKDKINYADTKREKHPKEKNIELYLNAHNNSAAIMPVTTNDLKVYIEGQEISPYSKKYPILLVKLRPNDRFKCHMKATLGVGDRNVIWSAARNAFYDEQENFKENNGLTFTIEGNGQCHEYDILIKSCKFLIKRFTDLKNDLKDKMDKKIITNDKIIYFKLDKEDHTLGEPLNYEFQSHNDIIRSGLTKPDHLVKSILIKVESKSGVQSPLNAMIECLDILINKYSHIGKTLVDLKSKKK